MVEPSNGKHIETKDDFEEALGVHLSWTDFAKGKTLVDSGRFSGSATMYLIHGGDNKCFIKCCENRQPCLMEEFKKRRYCEKCRHRKGYLVKHTAVPSVMGIDLANAEDGGMFLMPPFPDVYVPTGCPYAETDPLEKDTHVPFGRANARYLSVSNKNTSMVPIAWKIYKDDNKTTLSLQFKEIFVDVEEGNQSQTMFYQNITFDTKTGQSFISDIHNSRRRIKCETSTAHIDNITYTGESALLSVKDAHVEWEWKRALTALADAVSDDITDQGFNKGTYELDVRATVGDAVSSIAAFNRFPNLCGWYPLYGMYVLLPSSEKAKIKKLDRSVKLGHVCQELSVPMNDVLETLLAEQPGRTCLAYILANIGCDDPENIAFGCSDKYADQLLHALWSLMQESRMIEDPIMLLSLIAACSVGRAGWSGWMLDVVSAVYEPKTVMNQVETLILSGHALPVNRTYSNFLEHLSDRYADVVKGALMADAQTIGMKTFVDDINSWHIRKYKSDWTASQINVAYDGWIRAPYGHSIPTQEIARKRRMIVKKDNEGIGTMELRGVFSFDKRKFSNKQLNGIIGNKDNKQEMTVSLDVVKVKWYLNSFQWLEKSESDVENKHRIAVVEKWCSDNNVGISARMRRNFTRLV